jgi:hypothetical protein
MHKESDRPFGFRHTIFLLILLYGALAIPVQGAGFNFGVNADNWKNQIKNPAFGEALEKMGVRFVVWHISPEEVASGRRLLEIIEFSRKRDLQYLFNTELVNYVDKVKDFKHKDGTYRWDIRQKVMKALQQDPLFLGVVYDEPMLMQAMCGMQVGGRNIPPYFADTRTDTVERAYERVVGKIRKLSEFYGRTNRRLIFEMVFPDYAHAAARGGALPAPKLLKENYNDLMYYVYASAARQYEQSELWACVDLWFLDRFPEGGRGGKGYHTPAGLKDTLTFAYQAGIDYVYVEHVKGLVNGAFNLTDYGQKVVEFQKMRNKLTRRDWRSFRPQKIVRRFPDGYWGQTYSNFIPDHPYGSRRSHPALRKAADKWLRFLNDISGGKIPPEANNWNAVNHPFFRKQEYIPFAGLPPFAVVDHYHDVAGMDLVPPSIGN